MERIIFVSSVVLAGSVASAASITTYTSSAAFAAGVGGSPSLWDTSGFTDSAVTSLLDVAFTGIPSGTVDFSVVGGGSFYAGIASGTPSNWQQNLGNLTLASDVLAFGNSPYGAETILLQFDPGVTGLGFDMAEIESSSTEVIVTLSTGDVINATDLVGGLGNGFFGFSTDGAYVYSVSILNDSSEGILLGNFQAAFVPLPTSAWAGIGLGGIALVARSIRKKA